MNQTSKLTVEAKSECAAFARIRGIRFKRDIKFPRFSMKAGESWEHGFPPAPRGLSRTARDYFAALESGGDRFAFAGGYCFIADVEPVL
jgi:hypothetical protein